MSTDLRVGFVRRRGHGAGEGLLLAAADADPLPVEQRGTVADYLDASPVLVATTATADDALHPERTAVANLSVHTDGEWIWSGDIGYYVRTYGARVPQELLDRAVSGRAPRRLRKKLRRQLEDEFLPPQDPDQQ